MVRVSCSAAVAVVVGTIAVASTGAGAADAVGACDAVQAAVGPVASLKSLAFDGTAVRVPLVGPTHRKAMSAKLLFPRSYRRTEIRPVDKDSRFVDEFGFHEGVSLRDYRGEGPGASGGGTFGPEQVSKEIVEANRWLLGILGRTTSDLTLTCRARDATGAIDVEAGALRGRLDLTSQGAPARLVYQATVVLPPAKPLTAEETRAFRPPPPTHVEVQLEFLERRLVRGFRLPHRIVKSVRGLMLEEVKITGYRINPSLSAADFER